MTAEQTLADVLERTGVSESDFFGRRRSPEMTAARAEAIQELSKIGLSATAIGRIIRRNHVTVLYWLRPEMRARRSAYCKQYNDSRQPDREQRRIAKAEAAKRTREQARRRKPQKLRLSDLMAEETFFSVRVDQYVRPPQHVIDEARRRTEASRTLTAAALGDPPPGYSALDRREARV